MRNVKSEKGVITALVLISILFFTMFLISTYVIVANRVKTQKEIVAQTKEIYDSQNAEEIYNSYFGDINDSYIKDGLMVRFKLNGDFIDSSGNGYDATNSGLTFETDETLGKTVCKTGNGYAFFPATGLPNNTFTITIMAKANANNSSWSSIFGYGVDRVWCACLLQSDTSNFTIERGSGRINTGRTINIGEWHRYTVTVDSQTGKTKAYIDAEKVYEGGDTFNLGSGNGAIGSWISGSYKFSGYVSEAMIYNRALTQEEISKTFRADSYKIETDDAIIPIYTVEQLLEIGSDKTISINENNGKYYWFSKEKKYSLMNDLEFDVDDWQDFLGEGNDWIPIGSQGYKFDGNGKTIKVININDEEKNYNSSNNYMYYGTSYVENGLMVRFKLNGDFIDSSGNGYDATNSGLTFETDETLGKTVCKTGNGYAFFSATGLPNNTFTITIMAKANVVNASYSSIFGYGVDRVWCACLLQSDTSNFTIERGSGRINTGRTINIGEWHRYTVTVDSQTGKTKAYIDAEKVYEGGDTFNLGSGNGAIGSWISGGYKFSGYVSEAMIYNRALTQEEISQNYTSDYSY